MKKTLSIILALAMLTCFAACSKSADQAPADTTSATSAAPAATTTPTTATATPTTIASTATPTTVADTIASTVAPSTLQPSAPSYTDATTVYTTSTTAVAPTTEITTTEEILIYSEEKAIEAVKEVLSGYPYIAPLRGTAREAVINALGFDTQKFFRSYKPDYSISEEPVYRECSAERLTYGWQVYIDGSLTESDHLPPFNSETKNFHLSAQVNNSGQVYNIIVNEVK